jgi:uncharacterized protein (TIGR00255 family)
MKSMTGYGRGENAQGGYKVTVELSSINRKQSEISVFMPREVEALESRIRDVINHGVARGRVTARVSLHAAENDTASQVKLNTALARAYASELNRLAGELGMPGSVTLDQIVHAPGVIVTDQEAMDPEVFWPAIEKALRLALTAMVGMRKREGDHLEKDLSARIATMGKAVARVSKRAPLAVKNCEKQLALRLKKAGVEHSDIPEQRWLQEVVLFADKMDISEELTRLQSHFQQYEDCRKSTAPVGRTLDFLAQEMNREINTIGSKANDSLISREVVLLKTELEKFREQVQNVE